MKPNLPSGEIHYTAYCSIYFILFIFFNKIMLSLYLFLNLIVGKLHISMVTNQNQLSPYLGFSLYFHKSQIYTLCNYT